MNEGIATKLDTLHRDKPTTVCNWLAQTFNMDNYGGKDNPDAMIRTVMVVGYPRPCGGTHVFLTANLKDLKWGILGI